MAKSAKKRGVNLKGVKKVSPDRVSFGVLNLQIINRLSSGSQEKES